MILKLKYWWQETRASFWFLPALIVLGAVGLAAGLISLDANVELNFDQRWPLVFGAGASASRSLLTAVASSMITVAGVVFSITIVALSLTSSQYTSRVLGNFMRDRMNQVVLGFFVGIFAYCLVVLRTIRGEDEQEFVPSLAVLGGLALAFIGIGFLIYFIHHVSVSIQASSIISVTAQETIATVDRLFPEELAEVAEEAAADHLAAVDERTFLAVGAREMGYLESFDGEALLALAGKHRFVVRLEREIGEFVAEGVPLVSVTGLGTAEARTAAQLNEAFVISRHPTMQQNVAFGIRLLVDIALKALSPGVNDTTTAVRCVDYLGAILARLAVKVISPPHRRDESGLRVIARGPSFEGLLAAAFDPIRQNAAGNVAVLTALLEALRCIACQTASPPRRQALRRQAELITAVAETTIPFAHDRAGIQSASQRLSQTLDGQWERAAGRS